ncbi:cell division initiation protein, partial [Kitasatospora sp. NPDC091257]
QGYAAQSYDGYAYPQPPATPPAVPHQQQGQGQGQGQQQGQGQGQAQGQGLDETSFFDTSMIDMTRLRELGGR